MRDFEWTLDWAIEGSVKSLAKNSSTRHKEQTLIEIDGIETIKALKIDNR